jgi:hypothetical protein
VDDSQCRSYGIAGCWNTTSACEKIWQDQEFVLVKLLPGVLPPFFSYRELSQLVHSLIRYCKTTKDHLVCPGPCALNDKFILTKIHSGSVCVGSSDQGGRCVWSTKNWWRLLFDTITWIPVKFSTTHSPVYMLNAQHHSRIYRSLRCVSPMIAFISYVYLYSTFHQVTFSML